MNMCSVRQLPREPNTLGRVQLCYHIHEFNKDLLGFIEDPQCVAQPPGHGGPMVRGAYMIFILVESVLLGVEDSERINTWNSWDRLGRKPWGL